MRRPRYGELYLGAWLVMALLVVAAPAGALPMLLPLACLVGQLSLVPAVVGTRAGGR